jgi:hypothetical protein
MSQQTRTSHSTSKIDIDEPTINGLRKLNVGAGVLHLVSGAAMMILGNDFTLPVSLFNLAGPPGTPLDEGFVEKVADLPLAPATAAFMFLSALFHFIVASPAGFPTYGRELRAGQNRFRWVEYALSSTLMIVVISMIVGITELAALIGIGLANVAMILFGWVMEVVNRPGEDPWWAPFWFGCIAGSAPWVALVSYLVFAEGGDGPPGFVYGILVSIFLLFNCFAINQWLQYKGVGRWRDYVVGERTYIILSLVAKSALGWQIFANTLI